MHQAQSWMSSLAVAAAGGWFAARCCSPRGRQGARLSAAHHGSAQLGAKAARRADHEGPSVELGGSLQSMIRSPVLGQRLYDLFYYSRWQTSVPTKLNEVRDPDHRQAMDLPGRMFAHAPLAAKGRLSADIIADLKEGKRPSKMAEDEAGRVRFRHGIDDHQKGRDDETYARARRCSTTRQIVDLTAVSGNDVMVAMLLAMRKKPYPRARSRRSRWARSRGTSSLRGAKRRSIHTSSAEAWIWLRFARNDGQD